MADAYHVVQKRCDVYREQRKKNRLIWQPIFFDVNLLEVTLIQLPPRFR